MYPLLQRLEIAKWIDGKWEDVEPAAVGRPKRRFYKLTKSGQTEARKALEEFHISVPGVLAWT
jgi:DNA-binding PadR family transcriptional regulator